MTSASLEALRTPVNGRYTVSSGTQTNDDRVLERASEHVSVHERARVSEHRSTGEVFFQAFTLVGLYRK
jgi:hypothetical protein